MTSWNFGRESGFCAAVMLLLASCSTPTENVVDSFSESVEHDVVVDTLDATTVEDVVDSGDIPVDLFEAVTDAEEVVTDEFGDAADDAAETASDVLICGDVPKEGCPCDMSTDEPCCIMIAEGLGCSYQTVNGVLMVLWSVWSDCGCDDGPQCEGYEVYPLCPWESRKEYY